jgi:hypothetical protein
MESVSKDGHLETSKVGRQASETERLFKDVHPDTSKVDNNGLL